MWVKYTLRKTDLILEAPVIMQANLLRCKIKFSDKRWLSIYQRHNLIYPLLTYMGSGDVNTGFLKNDMLD